jgi:hypothetical protein
MNIGIAPILGMNLHITSEVSLGLELGYDLSLQTTRYRADNSHVFVEIHTRTGPFLKAVFLFRTSRDRFVPEQGASKRLERTSLPSAEGWETQ